MSIIQILQHYLRSIAGTQAQNDEEYPLDLERGRFSALLRRNRVLIPWTLLQSSPMISPAQKRRVLHSELLRLRAFSAGEKRVDVL